MVSKQGAPVLRESMILLPWKAPVEKRLSERCWKDGEQRWRLAQIFLLFLSLSFGTITGLINTRLLTIIGIIIIIIIIIIYLFIYLFIYLV